jgi:hypothetical protein
MPSNFFALYTGTLGIINSALGISMFANLKKTAEAAHGKETAEQLRLSENLLLDASERLVGVVLSSLGFVYLAVSSVTDKQVQLRIAVAGLMSQVMLFGWRWAVERHLDPLKTDWKKQAVGDLIFATGWLYAIYSAQ